MADEEASVPPAPPAVGVFPPLANGQGPFLPRLWAALKRNWPVWLVAGATFANGMLGILQILLIRVHEHPQLWVWALPFGVHHWGRSLTLAFGFALVYLSFQLFQRKRVAWWLAVVVLALATLAHLSRGHLWYTALAPAVTLGLLIGFRKRFSVRSEPRSLLVGFGFLLFSIVFAVAYGTLGFWLLDKRDFGINFQIWDAFVRTLREYTLMGNSDLVPATRHARWFLESLPVVGITAAIVAVYSIFRPLAYRLRTLPHERAQAKAILEQHGRSSLDYFKLWPDKSYFFSKSGRCFIAYKAAWSVAISLGDPTGPEDEIEPTIKAFLQFCSDNGWTVAFDQVAPDLIPTYGRLGLDILKIGEEAIVDLERFFSETAKKKEFRRARSRIEERGYKLTRYVPPHPPELLDEVEEISREWLSLPGRRERGFTLGRFERSYVRETPLSVLRDPAGQAIAFANEIPDYREGEATIDLMRHRLDVPTHAMDYVFLAEMEQLKVQGYKRFSLGLAAFAGVGDYPGASLQERAVHQIFERLNRFFSYKGLYSYKAKFEPIWEERFLVYQGGVVGLVRTAAALAQVTEG